jgi:DNA-binding NtrC family response regulator
MEAAVKRGTVLFVDDEPRVLTSMRAMFRRDYEVLLANSGQEALDLLRGHTVDVIVSDQRMPGMTGVEVLKAVKHLAPKAMRILLTGYADLNAIEASINEGEVFRYLTKPCPSDQLKEAIGLAAGITVDTLRQSVAPDVVEAAEPAPTVLRRGELGSAQSSRPQAPHPPAPVRRTTLTPILRRPAQKPSLAVPDASKPDVSKPGAYKPHARNKRAAANDVDLLVLTRDSAVVAALSAALDGSHRVHHVQTLEAAVAALETHPIGVMLTDTAVSEDQIATLTTTLKRHVPELVTIVASSRSDAQLLIDLINYGQIFRFLMKPLHAGQCRLSVESAVIKHRELTADPTMRRRHAVPEQEVATDGVIGAVFGRIRRLRDRFLTLNGMA